MNEVCEARPMIGNEAIARGAWEAGVKVAAAYPGTPSTEILEYMGSYPSEDLHAQWSTNEKVACDVAIGASFEGVRAMTAMKHVGLNVASDALLSQSYIGVNGGLVLVVCDDPGIHSSQNARVFGGTNSVITDCHSLRLNSSAVESSPSKRVSATRMLPSSSAILEASIA